MTTHIRRSRHQWQALVDAQARSGQSAAAFCRDQDIAYQSFMHWRKKLDDATSAGFEPNPPALTHSPFIEITPGLATEPHASLPGDDAGVVVIELALGHGMTLSIRRN